MVSKLYVDWGRNMEVNIKSLKDFVILNHANWFHVSEYYNYIGLSEYSYLVDEAEEKMMNLVRSLNLSCRVGREGYLYYVAIPEDVFEKWTRT